MTNSYRSERRRRKRIETKMQEYEASGFIKTRNHFFDMTPLSRSKYTPHRGKKENARIYKV